MPYKIIVLDEHGNTITEQSAENFIIASSKRKPDGQISSHAQAVGEIDRLGRLYLLLGRHIHTRIYPELVGKPTDHE